MKDPIAIKKIDPNNIHDIETIAGWYHQEWNTTVEFTKWRLTEQPNEDTLVQLGVYMGEKIIATGGLRNVANITEIYPRFKEYSPWLGLVYVAAHHRSKGYGRRLMKELEAEAVKMNKRAIYLYTFTAIDFYKKLGWREIERVVYKNEDTSLMYRQLNFRSF